jgi:hypothetical protein
MIVHISSRKFLIFTNKQLNSTAIMTDARHYTQISHTVGSLINMYASRKQGKADIVNEVLLSKNFIAVPLMNQRRHHIKASKRYHLLAKQGKWIL